MQAMSYSWVIRGETDRTHTSAWSKGETFQKEGSLPFTAGKIVKNMVIVSCDEKKKKHKCKVRLETRVTQEERGLLL